MENNLISVILPCLNEEKTILYCIEKANIGIAKSGLNGEIIVSDNGSTDKSIEIAKRAGAKIVNVAEKGYGSALRGGINAASGGYIIMGDSDSTYNFEDIPLFINKLNKEYDLVVGNRFLGGVEKGAMPVLNKIIGNPILSFIAKRLFNSDINDFHCGLRGFTKSAYEKMDLKSTGMEFATEMIAKSALVNLKITEVPTTLNVSIYPRKPHLKPFRDGLRHLYLMMTYSFLKLFNKSFNLILSLFLPLYVASLLFTPFTFANIQFSLGAVNVFENAVLVTLILKSMLKITGELFPEYIDKTQISNSYNNFGILYLIMGSILYFVDILYWSSNSFGFINQEFNLKIISIASLLFTYGIFETFRLFLELSLKYFKKEN